ncbi:YkvI family membrane protein [Helcococcus massiliensis]|uniref:YkvI family membrane protein n=1 Tax=Helcococcus massiliensis TaxID=2040290 RepID=UPI000CDF0826|nr:hypothetical protein [Helcococcus massiliensis]
MTEQLRTNIRKDRIKRSIIMAFAYVGVLTGAGLASGQELIQYFVGFGVPGLIAVTVTGLLHVAFGYILLSMSSYFLASEHSEVLEQMTHPIVVKLLDIALTITCFVIGFVMIAGAGSNLNQQFALPNWVGAVICAALIIIVSQFDFDKVSAVIGSLTPLIVFFIVLATIYTIFWGDVDLQASAELAKTQTKAINNVALSSLNYFAMCMMTGVSMAFVLGGEEFNNKVSKTAGIFGGFIVGIITTVATFTLYANLPVIISSDLPMQAVITNIHPVLGMLMSLVIYGMIFNTGISLYYALARRISGDDKKKFNLTLVILVVIGFGLSFVGFKKLVGIMYPIIGYMGILLILVIAIGWIKNKSKIEKEAEIRNRIYDLTFAKKDPGQDFSKKDSKELERLKDQAMAEDEDFKENVGSEIDDHIDNINE